jgi:malate dehydrogenase (oxaloacetate-decarboxylating)
MFAVAGMTLSQYSPALQNDALGLYPPLEQVREVSRQVALAVGLEAQRSGLAEETSREVLERRVDAKTWKP